MSSCQAVLLQLSLALARAKSTESVDSVRYGDDRRVLSVETYFQTLQFVVSVVTMTREWKEQGLGLARSFVGDFAQQ